MAHLGGCPPHYPLKFKTFVTVAEFFLEREAYGGNPKYKIDKGGAVVSRARILGN